MSFLNLKSLLPQRSPSPDTNLSQQAVASDNVRKISSPSFGVDEACHVAFDSLEDSFGDSPLPLMIVRSEEPVRIFICDRRRAILEKIVEPNVVQKNSNSAEASTSISKVFIADQYADKSSASWAFKFDFQLWNQEYNVEELCLQNFCSFLDRDHGKMAMDAGAGRMDSHNNAAAAQNNMLTPPWSGASRSPTDSSVGGSPPEHGTAYHRLPSSQTKSTDHHAMLDEEAVAMMKDLSAGRLERLSRALEPLSLSHIVFRDHSCYTHRPTLLLFWFLRQLRTRVSRLTFDSIQSDSRIPLEQLLDFDGIVELNFIQARQRPAFLVTSSLLMKWLTMDTSSERARLRLSLTGCRELNPKGLSNFVKAWCSTPEPCLFDTISIDVSSVSVVDFVHEMEHPSEDSDGGNNWRPPTPPGAYSYGIPCSQSAQTKQFTFKHKKGTAHVHYKYMNGRLMFTCNLGAPLPLSAMPRAASAQCFGEYNQRNMVLKGNSLHRNPTYSSTLSQMNNYENGQNSLVNKMFGFILRSNA